MPVWADAFGKGESQKSIWLTGGLLASPFGVVLGYCLTYVISQNTKTDKAPAGEWQWSFRIQAACLVPAVISILVTPSKYFNIEQSSQFRAECVARAANRVAANKRAKQRSNRSSSGRQVLASPAADATRPTARRQALGQQNGNGNILGESWATRLKALASNKVFVGLCLSLTGLYFVVTGIQYWLPSYLRNVLLLSPDQAALYYAALSISAPVSGVVVGGIMTTRAGGYNTREAQRLQCVLGACAVACAVPIPFFTNFWIPGALFWLLLFFGGAVLPPVTGIMLNSVNELHRTSANAVANLAYNLLGYLPAPSFYGMVAALAKGELDSDDSTRSRVQSECGPDAS